MALRHLMKCRGFIGVGDVVCLTLVEVGGKPAACIIDGKTKRDVRYNSLKRLSNLFMEVVHVRNPRSHISEELLRELSNLGGCDTPLKTLIIVDGEEDLATLAASATLPLNCCVVYGIPDKGVKVFKITPEVKTSARKLLQEFQEVTI